MKNPGKVGGKKQQSSPVTQKQASKKKTGLGKKKENKQEIR